MNEYQDVKAFSTKFGQIIGEVPQHLSARKLQERADFMQEELDEFVKGAAEQDLAQQADALVDLVYVALGTAIMMGLPWQALWDDVQRANMEKVPGLTHRGNLMDVTKPPGWQPPNTLEILEAWAYDRTRFTRQLMIDDKKCVDDAAYKEAAE